MASIFSNSESEVDSDSESEDTEHVFSHLLKFDLSTLCHDLMERYQQKAKHIKTLRKKCSLIKDELNLSKEKIENFEKEQLASMKNMSDKSLDKNELAIWDFNTSGYDRTKISSIIYGVSKSKEGGLGYHKKPYNPRFNILLKPSDPSSSSTAQKGLNAYFLLAG